MTHFLHLVYLIFLRHFITDVYLKPPFLQKKAARVFWAAFTLRNEIILAVFGFKVLQEFDQRHNAFFGHGVID